MFERFTERARRIMAIANGAAQEWNHEYIGTEHILIGVVKEGAGVGANILKQFGMTEARLKETMGHFLKSGPEMVTMGRLPQTPRSKEVIEKAIENARSMDHNYVGTEHLLLGLLDVDDGIAFDVLTGYGINKNNAQETVNHLLGIGDDDEEEPPHCFVCAKFDMCLFAQTLNKVDANLMESLFGVLADETMAEVFKFCGDKCLKFERTEE